MSIPFIQLGISPVTQEKLQSSDVTNKMQLAQGQGCTSDEEAFIGTNDFVSGHRPFGVCGC